MTSHALSRLSLRLLVVLLFGTIPVVAQQASPTPVDVAINRATAEKIENASKSHRGWAIIVRFTQALDSTKGDDVPATNTANYRIININSGTPLPIAEAQLIKVAGAASTVRVRLVIPTAEALNTADLFHLYALNLRFSGAPPKEPLQRPLEVRVSVDTTQGSGIDPQAEPKAIWGLKTAKDRDNSDVYASYEVTSARGGATTGTGDVKIAIPFYANFWSKISKFSPFADIKASSNEKADADSLKFGVEWFMRLTGSDNSDSKFPFSSVDLINTGKIEAPKNFDNINALWEHRWLFPSAQIPGDTKRFRMFIDPFVGFELGKNLRSPLAEARHKGIFRLYTGANLTINIPIEKVSVLKGIDFTSSYIRRWPLKRELTVKDDATTLLTFGKGPKDHSDSKITFKVNDYFGPFIGFEWGRLPPNYELVDHKWTFGILFKSKIRVK